MIPLVLISRNSVGERCVSIKETLLGVAKIFKDVAAVEYIRFLFTKFPKSEQRQFKNEVSDVILNLEKSDSEEANNEVYLAILK